MGRGSSKAIANNKSNKAAVRDRKPQLKNGQVGFQAPPRREREGSANGMYLWLFILFYFLVLLRVKYVFF